MILPIVAFGSPILRNVAHEIDANFTDLQGFIEDMWETMYHSNGVGLAAPQVAKSVRVFVMDSQQIFANREPDDPIYPDDPGIKQVFINPQIIALDGEPWPYNEGCLSIPKIREDVKRAASVTMEFEDENFVSHTQTFIGITGRIILHEYDHLEGKLFIDYLPPLKKKLLKRKLDDISKGKVKTDYRMVFPK